MVVRPAKWRLHKITYSGSTYLPCGAVMAQAHLSCSTPYLKGVRTGSNGQSRGFRSEQL